MRSPSVTTIHRWPRLTVIAAAVLSMLAAAPGAAQAASEQGMPAGVAHLKTPGFLLQGGRYTTVEVPGSRTETNLAGINEQGEIVGSYDRDADRHFHGFLRARSGKITGIDVPGALGTAALKVNNRGQVVGVYNEASFDTDAPGGRGFLFDHGAFTRIDFPGASESEATGINDLGQVVGQYIDAAGIPHGFLWEQGHLTTVDVPGAIGTALTAINDRGQMIGVELDGSGTAHGFQLRRGALTTFDAPGFSTTLPTGINDRGQIVGSAYPGSGPAGANGFLLAGGAGGRFTMLNVPGATMTLAFDVSDRGQVVGAYGNPAGGPASQ